MIAAASRRDTASILDQTDTALVDRYGRETLRWSDSDLDEFGGLDLEKVVEFSASVVVATARGSDGRHVRMVCEVATDERGGLVRLVSNPVADVVDLDRRAAPAISSQGLAVDVLDRIAERVLDLRRQECVPGIGVGIVTGDGTGTVSLGIADDRNGSAVSATTQFRLSSLTKPLTATAVLQLVEEGGVDLDAPVTSHVRGIEVPRTVTIRQLLTHTSGIARWSGEPFHVGDGEPLPPVTAYYEAHPLPVRGAVGAFEYSNHNYALLGELVATAQACGFEETVTRTVLEALGMTGTRFDDGAGGARGYAVEAGAVVPAPVAVPVLTAASGGWSTVEDLLRFVTFLLHPEASSVLAAYTVRLMLTDQTRPPAREPRGLGLALEAIDGHLIATHTGGWPGYSGCIAISPDHGAAVVALMNCSTDARTSLGRDLLRTVVDPGAGHGAGT